MRTLLVEDDPLFVKIVSLLMGNNAGPIDAALTSAKGLEYLRSTSYDLLITDLMMDGMNGADLIRIALSERRIATEHILVVTGERNSALLTSIVDQGIRVLHKPFTAAEFRSALADVWPGKWPEANPRSA
jgi:DNA-binding response OmpR family regulator